MVRQLRDAVERERAIAKESASQLVDEIAAQRLALQAAKEEQERKGEEERASAMRSIAEERAKLADERATMLSELMAKRAELEGEIAAMQDVQAIQKAHVRLNVGGSSFQTSALTLRRHEGSMLASMFSGRHKLEQLDDGSYFLDRDGELFSHILAYLRSSGVSVPANDQLRRQLVVEADYYGLDELAFSLRGRLTDYEECMSNEDREMRDKETSARRAFRLGTGAVGGAHGGLVKVFGMPGVVETLVREPSRNGYPLLLAHHAKSELKRGAPVTVPTLAAFQAKLRETFPHIISRIEKVESTKECGWLIAGGAALRALLADSSSFTGSDVDIFIWTNGAADPQASATRLARRIWNELVTADPAQEEWYIVRSAHVITMRCTPIPMWERNLLGMEQPVQIILRLYDSPSEVLHGFDHDACCVGYDGEAVMALPRALRALRHGYTILNPLHAWPNEPSYELRCLKYATRGFAVAVPGLQLERCDWTKICAIPLREHVGINRLMHLHCLQPQALTASVYPPKALNSMNWSAKAKVPFECQARRLFPNDDVSVTSEGWNGGFASTIGELDRSRFLGTYRFWINPENANEAFPNEVAWHLIDPEEESESDRVEWTLSELADAAGVPNIESLRATLTAAGFPPVPEDAPQWQRTRLEQNVARAPQNVRNALGKWEVILDARRDNLHIPRRLEWSRTPRTREYLNDVNPGQPHLDRDYLGAALLHD